MKKYISLILVCMMLPVPVFGLDLTMPDSLHGSQVAGAQSLNFTDHLVKWPELNERLAQLRAEMAAIRAKEKGKNNISGFALTVIGMWASYEMSKGHGKDGADGEDGKDGADGADGKDGSRCK